MEALSITGVILCGGQGSRMGGEDKGLVRLAGKPLFQHVAERLAPQLDHIMISANRNLEIYSAAYPTFRDTFPGFAGPLAGMLAGLRNSNTDWVAFVPCDVPFLPTDLIARLWSGRHQAMAAYAHDGQRAHPTLCLLNRHVTDTLEQFLRNGDRKLMLFFEQLDAQAVTFPQASAFRNINSPADLSSLPTAD